MSAHDTCVLITTCQNADDLPRLAAALDRMDPRPSEIVIVDDRSDDGTWPRLADVVPDGISRVRLVRNDVNVGSAASRNAGLGEARSRFVFFLDADDVPLPARIADSLSRLTAPDAPAAVVGRALEFRGDRVLLPRGAWRLRFCDLPSELRRSNPVYFSTLMIDRHQVGDTFHRGVRNHEDYEFLLRLTSRRTVGVAWPRPLALYRLNPGGKSGTDTDRTEALNQIASLHPDVRWGAAHAEREIPRRLLGARAGGSLRPYLSAGATLARSPRLLLAFRWQLVDRCVRDPRGWRAAQGFLHAGVLS